MNKARQRIKTLFLTAALLSCAHGMDYATPTQPESSAATMTTVQEQKARRRKFFVLAGTTAVTAGLLYAFPSHTLGFIHGIGSHINKHQIERYYWTLFVKPALKKYRAFKKRPGVQTCKKELNTTKQEIAKWWNGGDTPKPWQRWRNYERPWHNWSRKKKIFVGVGAVAAGAVTLALAKNPALAWNAATGVAQLRWVQPVIQHRYVQKIAKWSRIKNLKKIPPKLYAIITTTLLIEKGRTFVNNRPWVPGGVKDRLNRFCKWAEGKDDPAPASKKEGQTS